MQTMRRPSEAAIQAAQAARQRQQNARSPQALPPGRQNTYASQLQPQTSYSARQLQPEYATWQQPNSAQQAQQQVPNGLSNWQQGERAQQARPEGLSQRGQRGPESLSFSQPTEQQQEAAGAVPRDWQDTQPGSSPRPRPQWQDSGLQYTGATEPSQSFGPAQQSRLQQRQQAQQQPQQEWFAGQQRQAGNGQPSSFAGSAQKVEQQRRFAARQDAGIEEPRSDPRRRKPAAASFSPPAPSSSAAAAAQAAYTGPGNQMPLSARQSSSVQPGFTSDDDAETSKRSPGSSFAQVDTSSSGRQSNGNDGQAAQAMAGRAAAGKAADNQYYGTWQQGQNGGRQSQQQVSSVH